MGWVLRLVETGVDGSSRSVDVLAIDRPDDLGVTTRTVRSCTTQKNQ